MTPEEIAAKHCLNGHDPARCTLLADLKLASDVFYLSCGCSGKLVDRCADHGTGQFSEILLDQQVREARPIDVLDAENHHLKIILGRIALALGATGLPFEELPEFVRRR